MFSGDKRLSLASNIDSRRPLMGSRTTNKGRELLVWITHWIHVWTFWLLISSPYVADKFLFAPEQKQFITLSLPAGHITTAWHARCSIFSVISLLWLGLFQNVFGTILVHFGPHIVCVVGHFLNSVKLRFEMFQTNLQVVVYMKEWRWNLPTGQPHLVILVFPFFRWGRCCLPHWQSASTLHMEPD